VMDHPHLAARSAFPEVTHPGAGHVRVTATPFQVDGRPITPGGPAPYLVGEHTREVLTGVLGYSEARVAELARAKVVDTPV
jgi:crotonobetainyl-CoA:carnitine CoA-transferase CaiB-like acyl-CoA transferase